MDEAAVLFCGTSSPEPSVQSVPVHKLTYHNHRRRAATAVIDTVQVLEEKEEEHQHQHEQGEQGEEGEVSRKNNKKK